LLKGWSAAGLNVTCGVKTQLAIVEDRLVLKVVGCLSKADQQTLDERLRLWLQL